ncbi:MAG TPA: DNA repair protein RadC [Syntrophorhabdaceae bacterium]|nr:DNA repair protein RadC [Syntrophorhabdaceae bacterium]
MKRGTDSFTVNDLPLQERPRERLVKHGPDKLSAQELLAIVLGRGVSGKSVMSISQELIAKFGSIRGISEATVEELALIKGIGAAKAAQLMAVFELGKRQDIDETRAFQKYEITNPASVVDAVRDSISDKRKEHFKLLILNTRNRIVAITDVSTGTLSSSLVHPREVFRDAIEHSGSSVVLAHNHPSGNPEPSEEDLRITRRLADAGRIIGIEVLDHIIIGKETYVSFKEKGLL